MFNPKNESGENWHNDIKDDVCSEVFFIFLLIEIKFSFVKDW